MTDDTDQQKLTLVKSLGLHPKHRNISLPQAKIHKSLMGVEALFPGYSFATFCAKGGRGEQGRRKESTWK